MSELIPISQINGVDVVDSQTVASELEVQHKNLLETIEKYKTTIESEFGLLAFETKVSEQRTGFGIRQNEAIVYHLTEDQALFIGSLSRNTDAVVRFKVRLVKSFQAARRALQMVKQLTPAELQLQQAQLLVDIERKQNELDQRVRVIEEVREKATEELTQIDISDEAIPEETLRAKVRRLVNVYCKSTTVPQQETWDYIYDRLYYLYKVSIKSHRKVSKSETWLDVAERTGHLEKMFAIVSDLVRKSKGEQSEQLAA